MASLHPQVVHFAIALLVVGVALRMLSLIGRPAFVGPAAATMLLLGTGAVVATGDRDAAIATLQQLAAAFPSPRIKQRLDDLQRKTGSR